MSVQIIPGRDVRAGNCKARRVIRQCTFVGAAVAIGICVVGAFGANLDTGNSSATAVLSRPAPADRWLIPPRPIDPPYGELDLSAQRAQIVDQLYEELMRQTAPGCSSSRPGPAETANSAAMGSGC